MFQMLPMMWLIQFMFFNCILMFYYTIIYWSI